MYKYFLSENLKTKRTFARKVVFLLPILTAFLSFFLATNYFQIDLYNWWYTDILQQVVCLEGIFLYRIDGKMKNRAVISMPIDLKKVYLAKILVGVKNIAVSCMLIFVMGILASLIIKMCGFNGYYKLSICSMFAASIVMIFTTLFQLPIFFFIGRKIGLFFSVIITEAIGIGSVVMAPYSNMWFLNPFAYVSRALTPILNVLPNGLPAVPESVTYTDAILSIWSVPFSISICIVLFVVITILVVNHMKKQEAV